MQRAWLGGKWFMSPYNMPVTSQGTGPRPPHAEKVKFAAGTLLWHVPTQLCQYMGCTGRRRNVADWMFGDDGHGCGGGNPELEQMWGSDRLCRARAKRQSSSLNLLQELVGKEMSGPRKEEGVDTTTSVLHVCSTVGNFRLTKSQEDTCITTHGFNSSWVRLSPG